MSGLLCEVHIPSSSLPGRTSVLVERDRRRYDNAVDQVLGRNPLVHVDPFVAPDLTLVDDRLLEVLADAAEDDRLAALAAFVAGRCTTGDADGDRAIHEALRAALETVDRSRPLGSAASLFVEAVMSLALLGDVDLAIELFTEQLTHPTHRSMEDALMAGYLAQLGGTSGYPVVLQELGDPDSAQLRRTAVEQLITFLPYDGRSVGATVIDVHEALRRAAEDPSEYVSLRVHDVLVEAGLAERSGDS